MSNYDDKNLDICGLILCAGSGSRSGLSYNKMLHYVGSKTILEMTLDRFFASRVGRIMLVVSPEDYKAILHLTSPYKNLNICLGGKTRSESVRLGLHAINECDVVVIHDGARPYIKAAIIDESIECAVSYGSGVVAIPAVDTIKRVKNQEVVKSLARSGLYQIQTPQTFLFERIKFAYSKIKANFTDDSEYYKRIGFPPHIVLGDSENIKITTPFDVFHPMQQNKPSIGTGFDVHQLVSGRPLILGGVVIPHSKGLLGHSDADVVVHAIMDALLSAAHLPDIGNLFPDTNPAYKNVSSIRLLVDVNHRIRTLGYQIGNISAVIMAQSPKLSPYINLMCQNISESLQIHPAQVSISATTTETLGIIGQEQGMAASATCLLTL